MTIKIPKGWKIEWMGEYLHEREKRNWLRRIKYAKRKKR
jgi:hypothetical protein